MKALSGILVVSLLFLIYDTYQRSSAKTNSESPQSQVSQPVATPPGRPEVGTQRNLIPSSPTVLASAVNPIEGWGRNPFLRLVTEEKINPVAETMIERPSISPPGRTFTIPELKVSALTWTSGEARALINGRIFEVGDVIEGMLIMEIDEASVTLRGGGRTLTLEVGT